LLFFDFLVEARLSEEDDLDRPIWSKSCFYSNNKLFNLKTVIYLLNKILRLK
jgi:hypothetical protein